MTPFEIPLKPTPQTLAITLAGVQYRLTVRWNWVNDSWVIDISDTNSNPLVTGIPMVTGADLLEQFAYLGFGGQLIAQTDNDPSAVPTFTNLGTTGHLYFVTP
jgi:hypothetical protein